MVALQQLISQMGHFLSVALLLPFQFLLNTPVSFLCLRSVSLLFFFQLYNR